MILSNHFEILAETFEIRRPKPSDINKVLFFLRGIINFSKRFFNKFSIRFGFFKIFATFRGVKPSKTLGIYKCIIK